MKLQFITHLTWFGVTISLLRLSGVWVSRKPAAISQNNCNRLSSSPSEERHFKRTEKLSEESNNYYRTTK